MDKYKNFQCETIIKIDTMICVVLLTPFFYLRSQVIYLPT